MVIGNFVTSSLFTSFTHTWILSRGGSIKTRLAVFVNEINLYSTSRKEEVHWPDFGAFKFHVPANYDFSIL